MSYPGDTGTEIDVIRAWYSLEQAFEKARSLLRTRYGITGEQLAILRIINERDPWALADLRNNLSMHPATLGQLLGRMEKRGFVVCSKDPDDKRRRLISVTASGREICNSAPLIGPVRLRTTKLPAHQIANLSQAFSQAIVLFGLEEFTSSNHVNQEHRKEDLDVR